MTESTNPDPLLDSAAAAAYLGMAQRTLETWRNERRGPAYIRISPTRVRYQRSALDAFIRQAAVDPARA